MAHRVLNYLVGLRCYRIVLTFVDHLTNADTEEQSVTPGRNLPRSRQETRAEYRGLVQQISYYVSRGERTKTRVIIQLVMGANPKIGGRTFHRLRTVTGASLWSAQQAQGVTGCQSAGRPHVRTLLRCQGNFFERIIVTI